MRILLFGKNGQVGWELQRSLATLGEVVAVDFPEIDFMDPKGLREFTLAAKPDLIVNAAGYTAVDKAESEPEIAMRINGEAPGVLAEVARKLGVGLVHYSSDYVFDGTKGEPYTEEDEPNPINVYGETKLAGDRAIQESGCAYLILRTSWVFSERGKNFFLTMLQLASEQKVIRVVDDQIGSPTWSHAIAEATTWILKSICDRTGSEHSIRLQEKIGLYNYCSQGECSWFAFAEAIHERYREVYREASPELVPILSEEYRVAAKRPKYSILDTAKIANRFDIAISSWEEHMEGCWQILKNSGRGSMDL